jgi:hypothetical protein
MNRCLCFPKLILATLGTIFLLSSQAQQFAPIYLKNAVPLSERKVLAVDQAKLPPSAIFSGSATVFLQFKKIPSPAQVRMMAARGIQLLQYIPENTYLSRVKGKWTADALEVLGVVATIPLSRDQKFDRHSIDEYANSNGSGGAKRYHLAVLADLDYSQLVNEISAVLKDRNQDLASIQLMHQGLLEIKLDKASLDLLLNQPFVLYAMPAPDLKPFNIDATDRLEARLVQQGTVAQPGLTGQNVVVGMGDDGRVDHVDNGYNEEGQNYNSSYHATHVAGTIVGAGVVNPIMRGFAYKATLLVDYFNTIIYRAPDYYRTKRMVLTNNSYGAGSYCVPYSGEYSGYCGQVDQQALDYPNMLHVFAAGNSGGLICGNYPAGYRAIDNSFQAGKNVITVGGTSHDGLTNKFSRGPVNDGRLKPEIAAIGNSMVSTVFDNLYGGNQGTSMAAPQITGGLALMVERYRQQNGDQDPPGDLLKAILCNTATDIQTKGPDFSTGFGWMNLKRAIDVIDAKSYKAGTLEQDGEQTYEINLDREAYDFKIMLYWHDRPSSYYTLKNLVNDLDLTVQGPDGSNYDPLVLDTSATGVTLPAKMGKDHLNNIEQVVIDHALPGRYFIKIKGYKIPFGPQPFKLVYNWSLPGLKLLQPLGGEQWKPGETHGIFWEDAGRNADNYQFDYSLDNGANWVTITGLTGSYNRMDWTLPAVQSTQAKIRMTNLNTGETRVSPPFVILPEINFNIGATCAGEINVNWTKPAGVDSVAILLFTGNAYSQVAITNASSFVIRGLRSGPNYWVTLQPIVNGQIGERSIAKALKTPATVCVATGAAKDFKLDAVILPPIARQSTSTALAGSVPVKIQLTNMGSSPTVLADTVFLSLTKNGTAWGKDTLVKAFTAGEQYVWNTKIPLTATPGDTWAIRAQISIAGDPVVDNNFRDTSWRFLLNPVISLPYVQDFSLLKDTSYGKPGVTGIVGADPFDLLLGSSAITVQARPTGAARIQTYCKIGSLPFQLLGTFNFSALTLGDNLRLSLTIPAIDEMTPTLAIRGSDTSPWLSLPLYDPITGLTGSQNLDISRVLANGGQSFSSSFQLRISGVTSSFLSEFGVLSNLKFYSAKGDMAVFDLNIPKSRVTDGDTLQVYVGAYNKLLTTGGAFSISLQSPDGKTQSIQVPSMAPNNYGYAPFTVPVKDWPAAYAPLKAWVVQAEDQNHDDDSLQAVLAYSRKITQFPYLQGFEQNEAGWGNSFVYALSNKLGESIAPFTPANGKQFWGTQWVGEYYGIAGPVPAGYLFSPLFDLSGLQQPWLSMSVNKQLCSGLDSVMVQYSLDTGRTWTTLNPPANTTNWYNSPGKGSWFGCGQNFWQVVSAPLPKTNSGLQLRILSLEANPLSEEFPRVPGGLLVDDIHVFDLAYPVFDLNTPAEITGGPLENGWSMQLAGGKVVASALPAINGNRLQVTQPIAGDSYNGNRILPKTWIFSGANSNDQQARVRLYFTHQEVMNWLNTIPCDTCRQPRSPYDLAVYRYAGPSFSINASVADNLPGYDQTWPAAAFDLVPYEAGYYAEIPAAAYGEFYIGLDEQGSGLDFQAARQPGVPIVLLNWTIDHPENIQRFEIERAPKTGTAPNFSTIGTVSAVAGKSSYTFRDIRLQPPGTWYYRLKLVDQLGGVRYSVIRTISFESGIQANLYPNPTSDGRVTLFLENTEGKTVELALYDQSGRYLWGQRLPTQAARQQIPLMIGNGKLPNGVYPLKIMAEGEKKTIQLVISRN